MNDETKNNQDQDAGVSTDSRRSKVVSKKPSNQVIAIVVIAVVVGLIFALMFMGGRKPQKKTHQEDQATDSSLVLEQNEARLAKLRNSSIARPEAPLLQLTQTTQPPKEDKALLARQNAPTQMYNASHSISGTAATTTNSASVLAGEGGFSKFASSQSDSVSVVSGKQITHPRFTIAEGDFVHAVLETAINSDLPGMVRAVVTEPVYAYTGDHVIIPAGSRLVGQYDSRSSNGLSSSRIFVMWNRVITPQGISIMINSPGTDTLGRSGEGADRVDTHFFRMFGTASLLSVIGAATSSIGVGNYDQPNSANQYRQSVGDSFQKSAQNAMSGNLKIKPTLHIYQGNAINVFVARDLDLYNVLGQGG